MKSNYEDRATKFAQKIIPWFMFCDTLNDFEEAICVYNSCHSRPLFYAHGVSRIAIIRSDYVVKFDFTPIGSFANGIAGDIDSEQKVYAKAVSAHMEHLLAKTTVKEYHGRKYSIMPRINGIGREDRYWRGYCTSEEYDWLCNNINDLHEHNVGYRNGKVCVIDYAWDADQEEEEEEESYEPSIFSGAW